MGWLQPDESLTKGMAQISFSCPDYFKHIRSRSPRFLNIQLTAFAENIAVYDGYTVLSAANNPEETITLSGFRTPKYAPSGVDSTLSVFAGEGDRNILEDEASLTNQDGYEYDLPDTSGAGSYFASFIEGLFPSFAER